MTARHPSSAPSPSVLRAALAWADEAPSTRAHPAPERYARVQHEASEGPRPVEDDPLPSSRPVALICQGVGLGDEEWMERVEMAPDEDTEGAMGEVRRS